MQRRVAWRLVLLMLPALFWSAVFAALAGAGPLGGVPDAAQILFALTCTLAAAFVGLGAVRRFGH